MSSTISGRSSRARTRYTGEEMRILVVLVVAALAVVTVVSTASAEVQLAIQNGRVTLVAKDATVRQILTEWVRIGQTKIVNLERIPGGPQTIELRDVSEQQALKVLLRSVSGYVAAPRVTPAANASLFDRIIVMPTVAVPPSPVSAAPPAAFATFQQPQPPPGGDDERGDASPQPQPGNRGPVFVFQPPPGVNLPPQQPQNVPNLPGQFDRPNVPVAPPTASFPGAPTTPAPIGVSTPGMMVPVPAQPGQRGQPGQPPRQP